MGVPATEAAAYRYERKFAVSGLSAGEVRGIVRAHPSLFFEEYPPRWINNVYLDTPDLSSLRDNADGVSERGKLRIRWYGELLGRVERPVLEEKRRRGLVGRKIARAASAFEMQEGLRGLDLARRHGTALQPSLLNRYHRQYYRSADRRFRVTIDTRMRFHSFDASVRLRRWRESEDDVIVELKYGPEHEPRAHPVSGAFPFRLSRGSKYATGMSLTDPRVRL